VINKFIIIVIVQGEKTKIEKEKGKKGINLGRNEQQNGESACAELCMHAANPRAVSKNVLPSWATCSSYS